LAIQLYLEWQQSKVIDEALKTEFRKAYDVTLVDGLDLEQVYKDQDPDFYTKNGIKRGAARRFKCDIGGWAKRYKVLSLHVCTSHSGEGMLAPSY
jgi:hypothetical protein